MSKRQELRDQKAQAEKRQRNLIIAGVLLIALAFGLVLILPNLPQPVGEMVIPEFHARPQVKFNAAGDPAAPVKIVVYSDFSCPHCANFWSNGTEQKIMETYVASGKAYFEYRSGGQFGRGPEGESMRSAEAAYCAGDQGKFWEMHDLIFANQTSAEGFTNPRLIAFAEKIGLQSSAFKECFNNRKYQELVTQDEARAIQDITSAPNYADLVSSGQYSASGFSTPSFLINGKLIPGALPFAEFQKEIDAALIAVQK
jgi:protein-disulfide isomerase